MPQDSVFNRIKHHIQTTMFGTGGYEFGAITLLSVLIGVVAGYAAVGFYLAIDLVLEQTFGLNEKTLASGASALAWWHIMAVLVGGGLVVGQLLRFLPNQQARGVPNVIEAAALNDSKIDAKEGFISAIVTILSLGTGASTGREGPVVHLGATLSSLLTNTLKLNPAVGRTLLGCGVAAAVSASFNAPIAGVFFALEVIIGHYALHTFAPIVVAAIAGTLVSRAHIGDFPAFQITDYAIVSFWEFPAFFLLGIVGALVAVTFMSGLNWGDSLRVRLHKIPYWLHPAIAGIFLGLIALIYPEVLSVGYEATSNALNGDYGFELLVSLVVAKMAAVIISIGGRFGGGVFSPSLFIGAMTGAAFGIVAASLFPDLASEPGLYAIVGMGAVASAVLGAPISTILIIFEITGNYDLTIAVMIGSAVASMVTSLFYERSFFLMQLANRGIQLEGGRATHLLKAVRVHDYMNREFFTIRDTAPATEAYQLLQDQGGGIILVINERGEMTGVLSLNHLPGDIFAAEADKKHTAGDYAYEVPYVVIADDAMQIALNRMDTSGEDILPVMSPRHEKMPVGLIYHKDVIQAYNKALLETHGQTQNI